MVLYATELELKLSEAIDKNPRSVRLYSTRLLAELILGRRLTQKEARKLNSKVCNSFPRNYDGPGYKLINQDGAPKEPLGFIEILRVLDRANLIPGGQSQ